MAISAIEKNKADKGIGNTREVCLGKGLSSWWACSEDLTKKMTFRQRSEMSYPHEYLRF